MIVTPATLFWQAQRFVGLTEIPGKKHHPLIVWMLQLSNPAVSDDETPWCSAYVNAVCWLLRLPRSKSNRARSWLQVGREIALAHAVPGDVVILSRGTGKQPGPEVIKAPGHVGLYAGHTVTHVRLLSGNSGNTVTIATYDVSRVLGVRRVTEEEES